MTKLNCIDIQDHRWELCAVITEQIYAGDHNISDETLEIYYDSPIEKMIKRFERTFEG